MACGLAFPQREIMVQNYNIRMDKWFRIVLMKRRRQRISKK
jgi:hypothetical protein